MGSTVILPDFILPSRANQRWQYSGMDSLDRCFDKNHFLSYPYPIEYVYNSRGFRDSEWPDSIEELKNAIWCVGDSFTVGIGQPYEHIWSQVLSKKVNQRTINVSLDGASNEWICRRTKQILEQVNPKLIVILWSYFNRREHIGTTKLDENRRMHSDRTTNEQDIDNFYKCIHDVDSVAGTTKIVNGLIPKSSWMILDIDQAWNNIRDSSWPDQAPHTFEEFDVLPKIIKKEFKDQHQLFDKFVQMIEFKKIEDQYRLIKLTNLDFARDYHHFDLVTSEFFVKEIQRQFNFN